MSKVTESRKKVINIINNGVEARTIKDWGKDIPYSVLLDKIKEIILDDNNWNEAQEQSKNQFPGETEAKAPEEGEYRSLLDVVIDFMPDEPPNK